MNANLPKPPLLNTLEIRLNVGKLRWGWLLLLAVVVVWDGITLLRHPGIILSPLVVTGIWLLVLYALSYPIYRFIKLLRGFAFCLHWVFLCIVVFMVGGPRFLEDPIELEINPVLTFLLISVRAIWLIGAFVLMRLWLDDVAERADQRRALSNG
jgi:hypothetical protein